MKKLSFNGKKLNYFINFSVCIVITFFGARRRRHIENIKDVPKLQLSKYGFEFFRTF
jgi:hypothetical protein